MAYRDKLKQLESLFQAYAKQAFPSCGKVEKTRRDQLFYAYFNPLESLLE